jgi:hypothetical protein
LSGPRPADQPVKSQQRGVVGTDRHSLSQERQSFTRPLFFDGSFYFRAEGWIYLGAP